ncbi:DUF3231 family protein [Bacillus sp. FJAT-49736]|uniref:DUF3231 family protein n=1 Tax=Bacillus sp. FJAT-49736 TaxID=2833582 RepID=UPI001BC9878E|nr:DUF3231 family protein [Bacillus sp. FJAT-49736]MBS4175606.1 DUF3231 family protein [Bacillus sp. FJAT-49736]
METEHNIKLTASEISQLWAAYLDSSLSHCIFTYFLEYVEDTQIKAVIEKAFNIAQTHLQKLVTIFTSEGYPVPHGFKVEEDVNLSAPRLFSDPFILYFMHHMSETALGFYSIAKTVCARADVQSYFSECIRELDEFETLSKNLLLSKGLYIRSPQINPPEKVHFVKNEHFLAGWFGRRKTLTVGEISNLVVNFQRNALGKATMIGFSQVAQSKEVRQFMKKGKDIAEKHLTVFGEVLKESDLPVPMSWETGVTSSTIAPFSDKMMMFMTTALIGLSIGFYATSMATSFRKDLSLNYVRLSAEIGTYAEEGAKIMIKNGWLEEQPLSDDRDRLAKG